MSNAQILVSEGDESKAGEYLIRELPPWMPSARSTGNFKLLDVVGRAIDRLDGDIQDVDAASSVQDAETIPQLRQLGDLVNTSPRTNESKDSYQSRVIASYQINASEGTAKALLDNVSTILGVDVERLSYTDLNEHGVVNLGIPGNALTDLNLSQSDLLSIVSKQSAAGFRIESTVRGTFTYISVSDYNNGNHDVSAGYDGLDNSGNPKNNGGSYAGLIE